MQTFRFENPRRLRHGFLLLTNCFFFLCQDHSRRLINSLWHVDSGCSRHMTGLKDLLTNFRIINGGYVAFAGNKKGGNLIGQGEVSNGSLTLEKVNYFPELHFNLLSVSQICDKNILVLFKSDECMFLKPEFLIPDDLIVMRAPRNN